MSSSLWSHPQHSQAINDLLLSTLSWDLLMTTLPFGLPLPVLSLLEDKALWIPQPNTMPSLQQVPMLWEWTGVRNVLPATGWCGLAETGFPRGKPDLSGEQRDSRGGRGEELGKKGKTEKTEETKRKLGGDKKRRIIYFYFPCSSLPLTVLHSELRLPVLLPGQYIPRCGSHPFQCVNYLLPVRVDISTEIESKHWETCSLDLDWLNNQVTSFITLINLTIGVVNVHTEYVEVLSMGHCDLTLITLVRVAEQQIYEQTVMLYINLYIPLAKIWSLDNSFSLCTLF